MTKRHVAAIMLTSDVNQDGYVDYREFLARLVDDGPREVPIHVQHKQTLTAPATAPARSSEGAAAHQPLP